MSPKITQRKPCPECQKDAELTNWVAQSGFDPRMRQYHCPNCGNEFYVMGGHLRSNLFAPEPPKGVVE